LLFLPCLPEAECTWWPKETAKSVPLVACRILALFG
jgi:hypothetical protein